MQMVVAAGPFGSLTTLLSVELLYETCVVCPALDNHASECIEYNLHKLQCALVCYYGQFVAKTLCHGQFIYKLDNGL